MVISGLRISAGWGWFVSRNPQGKVDQQRSVYTPVMLQLLPIYRYDEWMVQINVPEEERLELCRSPEDLEHASTFVAVRTPAENPGVQYMGP